MSDSPRSPGNLRGDQEEAEDPGLGFALLSAGAYARAAALSMTATARRFKGPALIPNWLRTWISALGVLKANWAGQTGSRSTFHLVIEGKIR
ncbi:MAG: hypothetical protein V3W41_18190 [Planctomycetota bacterium]